LANAQCEVLKGQCIRSSAGLYYSDYDEFKEAFQLLLDIPRLRVEMGKNGKAFFQRHYTWDVIESKYLSILDRLDKER
jgi:glycosyltransferase involved in cell wall biosynthesis